MERRVVWAEVVGARAEVVGARAEVVGARAEVVGTRAAVWGAASIFDIAIADPKTIDFREKVTTRWMNEMNDNSGNLLEDLLISLISFNRFRFFHLPCPSTSSFCTHRPYNPCEDLENLKI